MPSCEHSELHLSGHTLTDKFDSKAVYAVEDGKHRKQLSGHALLRLEDMEDAILAPTPIKYLHLAAIRVAADDLDGARTALEQSREAGLAQQHLTPQDKERIKQIEDAIAAGIGES